MTNTTKTRPTVRIVQFINRTDSGEFGNDSCGHCGADGRYQYTFLGDDGKRHRAMAGCIKLFKVAPIADIHAKLIVKSQDLAKRYDGGHLNSWDTKKLEAIKKFYAGDLTEDQAMRICHDQDFAAKTWRASKGKRY